MTSMRLPLAGLALAAAILPAPAAADVTLKLKGTATGMVGAMAGDSTQYLKGSRIRVDQTSGAGKHTSTIIDATTRQMVSLDHDRKQARVIDMNAVTDSLAKVGVTEVQTTITPTAETRQIAGATCTVHDVKISIPMNMGGAAITMTMSGPQCLSKTAPGSAEFSAFYKSIAANGGFFTDPAQAKSQPAVAKAMADLQRRIAELGVPLASETAVSMEAEGPMADMMKKMGNSITTEVTSLSTAPIADSMFAIPEGYTVTKR
jgi:hypothetical protein